jgi:hypothetical protein
MIVELKQDELTVCEVIGRLRSLISKCSNLKDTKMGAQNGMESDVMGVIAEYAFAKCFNTFPDFGLTPRSGSCDGVYKNYRYDIKSTKYKNGQLLSTLKVNKDVDLYVLAIVDNNSVNFVGYVLKDELIKKENIKDLGRGLGYCLEQTNLRPFKLDIKQL